VNFGGDDPGFLPFRADYLTPQQFADMRRSACGDDAPIRALMFAILELGLRDALGARQLKYRYRSSRRKRKNDAHRSRRASARAESALAWIDDRDADGVFSFQNICDVLEIDADRLRGRINATCDEIPKKCRSLRRRGADRSLRAKTVLPARAQAGLPVRSAA
jgi:hypothetical protein